MKFLVSRKGISALPSPLDKIFACLVASSIVVGFLAIILDSFKELAITVGVTIGILFGMFWMEL